MNDKYKENLGAFIEAQRKAAGLSKAQLGMMAEVSRLTIRRIEHGQANPTVDTLLSVTSALGVSLADAFVDCERGMRSGGEGLPPTGGDSSSFVYRFTDL